MSIVSKSSANWRLPVEIDDRRSWCEAGPSAAGIWSNFVRSNMPSSSTSHAGKPATGEVRILPVAVSGEIRAGESLGARLLAAARSLGLRCQEGDILVVKHETVSKTAWA